MAKPSGGVAMLLSSLGIDVPDMLKKFEDVTQYINSVDAALKRIEEKQDRILTLLQECSIEVETPQLSYEEAHARMGSNVTKLEVKPDGVSNNGNSGAH
jgi:hypothetical protein